MSDTDKLLKILSMRQVLVSSDVWLVIQSLPSKDRSRLSGVDIRESKYLPNNTIMGMDDLNIEHKL